MASNTVSAGTCGHGQYYNLCGYYTLHAGMVTNTISAGTCVHGQYYNVCGYMRTWSVIQCLRVHAGLVIQAMRVHFPRTMSVIQSLRVHADMVSNRISAETLSADIVSIVTHLSYIHTRVTQTFYMPANLSRTPPPPRPTQSYTPPPPHLRAVPIYDTSSLPLGSHIRKAVAGGGNGN